jgi:opacity protein-like surface antigen
MKRWIAVMFAVVVGLAGANQAFAQDSVPGPGAVVVTIIPGGATFFTEGKNTKGPSFGSYSLGAGVEYNFNRYIGVEGEVSGALGVTQDLQLTAGTLNAKTPDLINYSGNLVVSVPTGKSVVPYATGGVGGLTYLERAGVQVNDAGTFLTGNVGGGVKWYVNRRWGLRGDYRFIVTKSQDDAPAFFGQETRYGHRVYGGLLINAGR